MGNRAVPSVQGEWLVPVPASSSRATDNVPTSFLVDAWLPLLIEQFGSQWFEMGTISISLNGHTVVLPLTELQPSLECLPSWRKETFRGGQLMLWMVRCAATTASS